MIDSARNDFYEKIENLISPKHVETGIYINDIVALWIALEGLQVGHIVRIVRSPSLKSNFPVFEWQSDSKKSKKVTICFRVLNFEKKACLGWELESTPSFRWSEVLSILKVVGKVSGSEPKWPIYVDLTDIFKELRQLQEMDKERKKKEDMQREDEREKLKKGNPENMTMKLLREILDEMGNVQPLPQAQLLVVTKAPQATVWTLQLSLLLQNRVPAILPLLRLGFAKHGKLYNLHSLLSIIGKGGSPITAVIVYD